MIVYLIENIVTSDKYVGQTTQSIKDRFHQHCSRAKHEPKTPLHEAINNYGKGSFKISSLQIDVSKEDADLFEQQYIEQFGCIYPNGYNVRSGEKCGGSLHQRTKKIIGEQHKNKVISEKQRAEHSERMNGKGNSMYGKTHSEDAREKMRKKALGRKASEETRKKMSEAQKRRNKVRDLLKK